MTKLRRDWHTKMHQYVGYRLVEDDDDLRAFNAGIKSIIRTEKMKFIRTEKMKWKQKVQKLKDRLKQFHNGIHPKCTICKIEELIDKLMGDV